MRLVCVCCPLAVCALDGWSLVIVRMSLLLSACARVPRLVSSPCSVWCGWLATAAFWSGGRKLGRNESGQAAPSSRPDRALSPPRPSTTWVEHSSPDRRDVAASFSMKVQTAPMRAGSCARAPSRVCLPGTAALCASPTIARTLYLSRVYAIYPGSHVPSTRHERSIYWSSYNVR